MHGPGCKYLRLKKIKTNMSQKKKIEKVLVILRLYLIENLTSVDSDFEIYPGISSLGNSI